MTRDDYQSRQDILHDHVLHIEDLGKDNAALTLRLKFAESEIGRLKVEIERLANGMVELVVKVEESDNEVGRLGIVLLHPVDSDDVKSAPSAKNAK